MEVNYIDSGAIASLEDVLKSIRADGLEQICYTQTDDYLLQRRMKRWATKYSLTLKVFDNPNFIESQEEIMETLSSQKSYLMANFYTGQRKKYGILLESDGKPLGGKWNFDADNRKKVPKGVEIPKVETPNSNEYIDEAKEYVENHFGKN